MSCLSRGRTPLYRWGSGTFTRWGIGLKIRVSVSRHGIGRYAEALEYLRSAFEISILDAAHTIARVMNAEIESKPTPFGFARRTARSSGLFADNGLAPDTRIMHRYDPARYGI